MAFIADDTLDFELSSILDGVVGVAEGEGGSLFPLILDTVEDISGGEETGGDIKFGMLLSLS